MKKIAFTGPFADVNFGDYAMIVNNIYDLGAKEVVLFSYDSVFLDKIKKDYLENYSIEIKDVILEPNFNKKEGYSYTPLELLSIVKNKEEIEESLRGVDVLVVNGGGYFNGLWSMPHRFNKLIQIIIPILIANQLNKEIVFTGNSYGPFGQDKEFFATLFSSLNNTTFASRDKLFSSMWFNQLGVDTNLNYIPDDLFFINKEILQQEQAFNLKTNNYIVMETYLPITYLEEHMDIFKKLSRKLKMMYNLDIVLLPFHLDHGGMDQALFFEKNLDNVELIDIREKGYLPIQDAVNIIKNAQLVISSRYHALTLALANCTPAISVLRDVMDDKRYYYNKNSGVIRLALENTVYDETKYLKNEYHEAVEVLISEFEEYRSYQAIHFDDQYKYNIKSLISKRQNYIKNMILK